METPCLWQMIAVIRNLSSAEFIYFFNYLQYIMLAIQFTRE